MKTITSEIRILPDNGHLYDDRITIVGLDDLGAGAFVTVRQEQTDFLDGTIVIDAAEWPAIRAGIEKMLAIAQGLGADTLPAQQAKEERIDAEEDAP